MLEKPKSQSRMINSKTQAMLDWKHRARSFYIMMKHALFFYCCVNVILIWLGRTMQCNTETRRQWISCQCMYQ